MSDNTVYINVYVPQGQKVGSEKYHYKLKFMKALKDRVELLDKSCHVVLLGDINIAARDDDMYNPGHKEHKVLCLCTPEERQFYTDMLELGFKDIYREMHPGQKRYSWWKCFKKLWAMSRGYRLDYVFLPSTVERIHYVRSVILASYRYNTAPSDHAPVLVAYFQQPLKNSLSNFITITDNECFENCQCSECNDTMPTIGVKYNKHSINNGLLRVCANLGMIVDELEVGNSTPQPQEQEMDHGRNLLEEFKTPTSPEKTTSCDEIEYKVEEIINLREVTTFFYNYNEQWTNPHIEVDQWSRIAAQNAYHPDYETILVDYPIISDDNNYLISNPLEIMKHRFCFIEMQFSQVW
jgi:hypothetical protein